MNKLFEISSSEDHRSEEDANWSIHLHRFHVDIFLTKGIEFELVYITWQIDRSFPQLEIRAQKKKRIKKSYSFISKNKSLVIVINCGNNLILIKHFFRINFSSKTLTHMCSILFQLKLFQVKKKKKIKKTIWQSLFWKYPLIIISYKEVNLLVLKKYKSSFLNKTLFFELKRIFTLQKND